MSGQCNSSTVTVLNRVNMKKIILFVGAAALILNTFAGFLLPTYGQFNMILNDMVLFVGICVAMSVAVFGKSDAVRISLSIFNALICLVQYVTALVVCPVVSGNCGILLIVVLAVIDICVCFVVNHFSKYV